MAIRLLLRKRNEFKKPATAVRENNFEYWKTGMNHFGVVERAVEDLARRIAETGGKCTLRVSLE